ncbi:hypothetical protein ACROYT_G007441 [Oculina patagonica]
MSATLNTTRLMPNGSNVICLNSGNLLAEKIGKTFAYCVILVVSLAGNAFIGIIVYKTKTMRKTINYLIVNMAMSDLLFPLFAFPLTLAELHVDSWLISGPPGQAFCKLVYYLQDISTAVSVQSLVLITVDRFGAVVVPLRSPLISSKMCLFCISATWLVAFVVFIPYLFALKLVETPAETLVCHLQWNEAFGESSSLEDFVLAVSAVFLYIPFTAMTILYSIIVIKLKSKKLPGEQSIKSERQHIKRHRNVLKMSAAIVLGFGLCWLPLSVYNVLYLFVWDTSNPLSCSLQYYYFIASLIARANCAINPCICFVFSGNYRQGLKSLLNCFRTPGGWSSVRKSRTEFYSLPKCHERLLNKNNSTVSDQLRNQNFVMISAV